MEKVKASDYIAIAGVGATLLGILVTWLVMKRQFASKKLSYSFSIEPVLRSSDLDLAQDLKVYYKDELLPSPAMLNISIGNSGLAAVEQVTIVVDLPTSTYLIPGYFIDVPNGYSVLWDVERTDAEECTITLEHINPGQVARVRLLMDEIPKGEPRFSCAMPNVQFTKTGAVRLGVFAEFLIQQLAPQVLSAMRSNSWLN
jgi:hypothetical protein